MSATPQGTADRVIVIGGSAGSIEGLTVLVGGLPAELPSAVLVAVHTSPQARSLLPRILERAGMLPAQHAVDGEPLLAGRIYVAPPDHHLLLGPGHMHLSRGPRENGHRPAIDPLFRSAAYFYGRAATGVILSGGADDGSAGAVAIKNAGGRTVAQSPTEAQHPRMPESAIETGKIDATLNVLGIAKFLAENSTQVSPNPIVNADDPVHGDNMAQPFDDPVGDPSPYTCPECNGTLFTVESDEVRRYRCRIGHAYSQKSLEAEQAATVETTLWTAVRALEERAALLHDLADRMRRRGIDGSAVRMERQADEARRGAEQIRRLIGQGSLSVLDHDEAGLSPED